MFISVPGARLRANLSQSARIGSILARMNSASRIRRNTFSHLVRVGLDQRKRIDARSLHPHRPMQMGSGDAAGCAGESDNFPVLHDLAVFHIDSREMGVK